MAGEIEQAAPDALPVRAALIAGSEGYLAAMTVPGRTRLLLIDGPAVLGTEAMFALDAAHAGRTLREGLAMVVGHGLPSGTPVDALAALLSAAFDRTALAIASGADADAFLRGDDRHDRTHGGAIVKRAWRWLVGSAMAATLAGRCRPPRQPPPRSRP